MNKLETEIANHEHYNMVELKYFPREAFVECLLKVFYQIYYPTLETIYNLKIWETNVKEIFKKLNDLTYYYSKSFNSEESRIMIFLLEFNSDILKSFNIPNQ